MRLYGVDALKAEPEKLGKPYQKVLATAQVLFAEKRFFHWDLEFPEVFIDLDRTDWKTDGGFDAVVGNPPYIRAEASDKSQRKYIMNSGAYQTVWGRFDVYAIFIEQGLKLLNHGGFIGYIVPDAVLTINYAEKLRKWILQEKSITSILDARGENIFPGVGVSPCVLILNNTEPNENHTINIEALPIFRKGFYFHTTYQHLFTRLPGFGIRIDITDNDFYMKSLVDSLSKPLRKYCYFTTGLVGHNSQTGESVKRLVHKTKTNMDCKPYIEAKEWDGRYSWLTTRRYIEYKPDEMHRAKFPELFESTKMLIQRISSGPYIPVTVDVQGVYVNHVINCCVKAEDIIHLGSNRLNYDIETFELPNQYSIYYFLALSASRLLGYYHNEFLSPALDIFPETLRQLPIREINFTTSTEERETIVAFLKTLFGQETVPFTKLLAHIAMHLATDHNDIIHDLLAFLAKEMIRLNKEKQAEVNSFLDWLVEYTELPMDEWQLKTIVHTYYQKGWPEFRRALKRNEKKITAVDINGRATLTRLKKEYDASMSTLSPLLTTITATDRLIDQIVYQLYGLTDEEIAIVEGKQ